MNTPPTRNNFTTSEAGRPSPSSLRTNGGSFRAPPLVPHRRYPSLSDDFQPLFERRRPTRRPGKAPARSGGAVHESSNSPALSVRVIAMLAIIAIVAALVATA